MNTLCYIILSISDSLAKTTRGDSLSHTATALPSSVDAVGNTGPNMSLPIIIASIALALACVAVIYAFIISRGVNKECKHIRGKLREQFDEHQIESQNVHKAIDKCKDLVNSRIDDLRSRIDALEILCQNITRPVADCSAPVSSVYVPETFYAEFSSRGFDALTKTKDSYSQFVIETYAEGLGTYSIVDGVDVGILGPILNSDIFVDIVSGNKREYEKIITEEPGKVILNSDSIWEISQKAKIRLV